VFVATGIVATIFGGLLATGAVPALAAESGWLAAYLIIVAGIAQIALGAGQAWLAATCPGFERNAFEWGVLNLGNLGVVTGSLLGSFWIVLSGSIAFTAALGLFAWGVRPVRRRVWGGCMTGCWPCCWRWRGWACCWRRRSFPSDPDGAAIAVTHSAGRTTMADCSG
jgi:hypothetical protein